MVIISWPRMYQSLKTCFRTKAVWWSSQKSTELNKPDQIIALQMLYFSGHLIETNEKRLSIKIKTVPMNWVLRFLAFDKGKNQTQIFKQPWILTQPKLKQISFISNWRTENHSVHLTQQHNLVDVPSCWYIIMLLFYQWKNFQS